MAQASSNLVPKTPLYTPNFGVNSSSPSSAVFKQNTPLNIAYGGSSTVPSGSYTSNPQSSNNIFSGVVNRSQPTPQMGATLPPPKTSPLASSGGISSFGLSPDQYAGVQKAQQTVSGGIINPPNTNPNPVGVTGGLAGTKLPDTSTAQTPNADGSTQNSTLGTMVQVQDKTTGATMTMPLSQYQINQDKYNLAGEAPKTSFGTPVADTSSFSGLIKQAADAQAASRNFNQNLSNAETQVTQTGSDLPFQTGVQAGLEKTYGAQAQALSTAAQNATQLAGLASPQLASYSQQSFNPLTGQFGGGGSLQDAVSGISEKVKNGTMSYDDAKSALSGYGQGGVNALNQTLGPGFNVNQSNAGAAVQGQQTQQVAQYKSALQQGQNLQSQLTDLITSFGLNPNDVNAVNAGLQAIAKNVSSPQYKILNNYVNDIANTYSQILTPPGGSATDTTRGIATSMLDATAQGQSLITVMKSLDQAAQAKIAGVPTFSSQSNSSTSAPAGFAW